MLTIFYFTGIPMFVKCRSTDRVCEFFIECVKECGFIKCHDSQICTKGIKKKEWETFNQMWLVGLNPIFHQQPPSLCANGSFGKEKWRPTKAWRIEEFCQML